MKLRSTILVLLCILLPTTLFNSCTARQPIQIGFSGELTGKNAQLGVDGRNGALLAVETLNAGGGVQGRPLEMIIFDDLGSSEGAQDADRSLISKGAAAVIGHMTSALTLAGLSVTQPAGIVLISPTSSANSLTGKKDLFFRVFTQVDVQARLLAQRISQRGLKKIAVIYDLNNQAYAEDYKLSFGEEFAATGGTITHSATFLAHENPDFEPMINDLRSSGAEGLLILAGSQDAAMISQHVRLLGWNTALFCGNWAQTNMLIEDGGRAVEGIEAVADYDPNNPSPAFQQFQKEYRSRFGRESSFAAQRAYEAVLLLAAALNETHGSAEGLPQALLSVGPIAGPSGPVSLDPYGDIRRTQFLVRVQNGAWVTIASFKDQSP